jgi:hypothetical protein
MAETAVEVLERDHDGISELFERVRGPDEDRAGVLRVLVERLAAHLAVDRSMVLPEARKAQACDSAPAKRLKDDYHVIEHNLVLIERRKASSPDMPELVTEVRDAFVAHIDRFDRCQKQLYPDLERCLDKTQMEDLGERLRTADDVAIAHAHPHLLSLGPASRVMTRIAGGLDRMRSAGAWGGLSTTSNDNSKAEEETPDPVEGSVEPPPWRDPADG